MPEKDLPSFDPLDHAEAVPEHLQRDGVTTETIDLSSLYEPDVYSSGTFDLSEVGSTSLGRLLEALPVPAILINKFHRVVYFNQGCTKLASGYQNMFGMPFLDLVPRPLDRERAQVLANKTLALLDRVFKTRRPLTAEAILEIERKRIWARLNLRAVRIASERYVLVLIEDLTAERRQLELNRRRDRESEELRHELETLVEAANSELSATNMRLKREIEDHLRTQRSLRTETQKCEMLARQADMATAVVAPNGMFQSIDRRFQDLCGYQLSDVPNLGELMTPSSPHRAGEYETPQELLDSLVHASGEETAELACAVEGQDAARRGVRVRAVRLDDGNYYLACTKECDDRWQQPAE